MSEIKKIAIIGYGNHVVKNIIPAITRMKNLVIEAVYVRDPTKYVEKEQAENILIKSIEDSLGEGVDWVYISTPISTHYALAKKYLELGKNVICEKPLTDSSEKTKKLFDLSEKHGVKLHEVCMYQHHKQYKHLKDTVNKKLQHLKCIKTKFTIPHLDKSDIRYKKELAGGALLDVGFYPISLITSLFGKPEEIKHTKYSESNYDVDLFGSAIFVYKHFYCIAEWGIGLPYANEVEILTENQIIKYERIFSKPETFQTQIQIKEGFEIQNICIGSDDQFVNMFKEIIINLKNNDALIVRQIASVLNNLK